MKLSRYIPSFLIFLILVLSHLGLYYILISPELFSLSPLIVVGTMIALVFALVIGIVYFFYENPLKHLEYTIKRFLVGSLKEETIGLQKSFNPHLNYILLFFGKTLETLKHIKSEFIHGKEIKSEIDLAGEIQEKLLHKAIPAVPYLEIIGKSKPAAEIGGDSFDVIPQGENYYIYVGDATGH